MNIATICAATRLALLTLVASLFLSACGSSGSSDSAPPADPPPVATTGIVGILFTDAPTDQYDEINLTVLQAILIGAEEKQEFVFEGEEPINLLDLENFSEPVMFGEVQAGTYTKLRLIVDKLELIPVGGGDPIYPKLPGNGKIDLLQADGFTVLPGRTLLMEIDMDANKSIKITGAGNSGKVNFRPVVKVKIVDGGDPHKLARLEGSVSGEPGTPAGGFVLCDLDSPDYCVDVMTDTTTSMFDNAGLGTVFNTLSDGDMVVVIGRYITDPSIALNALVLEIGGNAEQVQGNVVSDPAENKFLLVADDASDLVVELQPDGSQPGTRYKADPEDPDLIRAALIFVEEEEDEQISGTIIEPIVEPTVTEVGSFGLTLTGGGDTCVSVNSDADILLVDEANSEVTMGTFDDLAVDQSVDLFGQSAVDSCFMANEVIVEVAVTSE
jgi:hypothetical protein